MKKVHIVSHTHWDREWYDPLYVHRLRLYDLFEDLIKMDKENKLKKFWLDGHYITVEDYLKVDNFRYEYIKKLVEEGKLLIGPWYILQDEFLTGNESQIRNLQIGIKLSKRLGHSAKVGYFPDSFGNAGQMPQILKKSGIDIAYFGRGVNAVGFNNEVMDEYNTRSSEIYWQSPDGTKIPAVLFANWYCNANEIPIEDENIKTYMDKRLNDAEKFASTDNLLLMNGCDHEPVQKNILEVIDKLNKIYDDYEFVSSDLEIYRDELLKSLDYKNLETIKGELRGQNSDGWTTLINCASSRVDLKKLNSEVERKLTEVLEPICTMVYDKDNYPFEKIEYIYRHMLTNHPHDSICSCGIDSIHEGNIKRLKECMEMIDHEIYEALKYYKLNVSKNSTNIEFTLINPSAYELEKEANVVIDLGKTYVNDFDQRDLIRKLEALDINYKVCEGGKEYETFIEDLGANFSYEIPKDSFRKIFFSRKIRLKFKVKLEGFERKTFKLIKDKPLLEEKTNKKTIENDYFIIDINDDATLNVYSKIQQKTYKNFLKIEDVGDIGNEYIFKNSSDNKKYYSEKLLDFEIKERDEIKEIILHEEINIPKKASDELKFIAKSIVPFQKREAMRDSEFIKIDIVKTLVTDNTDTLKLNIKINNKAKDHRMRLIFNNPIKSENVYAESFFEVAKRDRFRKDTWKNPDYSQHLNRFVSLSDDENTFTISTQGLKEYETLSNGDIAITLLRSVSEMGDWGYFETKDSNLLKELEFNMWFNFSKDRIDSYKKALAKRNDFVSVQLEKSNGNLEKNMRFLDINEGFADGMHLDNNGDIILRLYNPTDKKLHQNIKAQELNVLEDEIVGENKENLNPYQIRTIRVKR